jgi:hypothetical protein
MIDKIDFGGKRVKTRKLIYGLVVFLFLFVFLTGSLHAEPTIPAPNAPQVTTTPAGQPPVPVTKNDPLPGQNQKPGQLDPIPTPPSMPQPPAIPQVTTEAPPLPGDPNQAGFNPNNPPLMPPQPTSPAEAPIKNYQTGWFTSWWFLTTMVLLLVIVLLAVYSFQEGKAPSEEKEETTASKKKKNNKK